MKYVDMTAKLASAQNTEPKLLEAPAEPTKKVNAALRRDPSIFWNAKPDANTTSTGTSPLCVLKCPSAQRVVYIPVTIFANSVAALTSMYEAAQTRDDVADDIPIIPKE